jgi:hypothetical protein
MVTMMYVVFVAIVTTMYLVPATMATMM